MIYDVENIVVGAGVIGLAIARAFAKLGQETLLLEKNGYFGEETSSRNSEVIHAGIYYPKNSLKAQFCVTGKELLYAFCAEHHIPHQRVGKLIVATSPDEVGILDQIKDKAANNGVTDIKQISASAAKEMEPALHCKAALLSPSTGIIDTHQYMLSLLGDFEELGGQLALNASFDSAHILEGGFKIKSGGTQIICKRLINAGGLWAQSVAHSIDGLSGDHIPHRYLAKGSYFTMSRPSPFKTLIYPVPNTASLGVHVTLDMGGQIRFGPDQEWIDDINYDVNLDRSDQFYDAIRRYYPDLEADVLHPAYAGIRPKIQSPNGPQKDFLISTEKTHGISGLINLFGMESPGLTGSLAIANYVTSNV
jgi:L-2-hydroxyglutarate oxidase LhgO